MQIKYNGMVGSERERAALHYVGPEHGANRME